MGDLSFEKRNLAFKLLLLSVPNTNCFLLLLADGGQDLFSLLLNECSLRFLRVQLFLALDLNILL